MNPRAPEIVYRVAVVVGRGLFGVLRLRRIEIGLENLPARGGAVIAITHFGYLEFALVEWATWLRTRRHIRFLTKQSIFDKPVVGPVMRSMRHIPVDMSAGAGAYRTAVAALRSGELVGVFPEAGVSASFTVRELKTGAVRLAAEAAVPVIPVSVWGGHRLLTKNRRIRFSERIGVPVAFSVGAPMPVAPDVDPAAATAELKDVLERLLESQQGAYPDDGTGRWWQPRHLGGTAPTPEQAAAADAERNARRAARAAAAAAESAGKRSRRGGGRGAGPRR